MKVMDALKSANEKKVIQEVAETLMQASIDSKEYLPQAHEFAPAVMGFCGAGILTALADTADKGALENIREVVESTAGMTLGHIIFGLGFMAGRESKDET